MNKEIIKELYKIVKDTQYHTKKFRIGDDFTIFTDRKIIKDNLVCRIIHHSGFDEEDMKLFVAAPRLLKIATKLAKENRNLNNLLKEAHQYMIEDDEQTQNHVNFIKKLNYLYQKEN